MGSVFKTYPLHEREFIKVSYLPKEIELMWSLMLGVWVANIFSQEIISINFTLTQNLLYSLLLVISVSVYLCLISLGFNNAFKSGSIRAYAFILFLTFYLCIIILYYSLVCYDHPELEKLLNLKLSVHIVAAGALPGLFLLMIFWFVEVLESLFDPVLRTTSSVLRYQFRMLTVITLSIGLLALITWTYFDFLIQREVLRAMIHVIISDAAMTVHFRYKIAVVAILMLIILIRILTTEIFYNLNRKKMTLHRSIAGNGFFL